MRSFSDLTEAKETVVFGFGRFNPPTTGHEKLIEKVASVAGSNPFFIYPSHTTGPKDPLPHAKKVAWMRKMFPKYKKNIIADRNAKTAIQIAEKLYKDGYKNLVMVAGSDRLKEFDTLLQKYNDAPDKKGNQLFKFDSVKVVSAGERDPDAEGVEGMSASKMRAAASDGKFDDFKTGIPATLNDADKKKLYFEVRKNMGIREERQMGDDYDLLRDAYLTGKLWNVGDVVEARGNRGEVVRKGANYLSFMTEDGKVHKSWLHEILVEEITKKDLDQVEKYADKIFAKVGIDVEFTRHFMDRVNDARNKKPITTSELTRLFKQSFKKYGKKIAQLGPDAEAVINDMKTDVNMPFVLNLKGQELELVAKTVMRKKDFKTSGPKLSFEDLVGGKQMSGPTGQIFALKSEEVELDERNYKKEYANYGGKPEQIARRSSRNKARRAMGDKAVKGMDVGHKDNDPLNNSPENLRNEDPSDNRREPRLRKNEVKQDKDVDDKEGTQPAKYYAGDMAKSTKDKRDAHFKSKKSGPAPGDSAKTKPSTHTKKFKQMFGEVLPNDADQGDYIDDFQKSDAPQFKGKSKEKRKEMAIAAYLSKNEDFTHYPGQVDSKKDKSDGDWVKGDPTDPIIFDGPSSLDKANSEVEKKRGVKVKPFVEEVQLDEKIEGLVKKSEKSGMSYSILKKVYDRGMAAWKTGHRPGTTPQQWAFARVNSFTTKSSGTWGKADKDLAKQVEQLEELDEKGPGLWANIHKKRKEGRPMRKKGEKGAPTPAQLKRAKGEELEKEELNEWGEIEEESEYQGRKVTLNKPTSGDVKKSKVYVKNEKGNVVKVNFGDPNMTIKKSNPARRKSFRARHNCENPGPKWKARYWSCKAW